MNNIVSTSKSIRVPSLLVLTNLCACGAGGSGGQAFADEGDTAVDTGYPDSAHAERMDFPSRVAVKAGDIIIYSHSACEGRGSSSYSVALGSEGAVARGTLSYVASGSVESCKLAISATLTNDTPAGSSYRWTGLQGDLTPMDGVERKGWISGWKEATGGDYVLSATASFNDILDTRPYFGDHNLSLDARHILYTDSKTVETQTLTLPVAVECCAVTEAGVYDCYSCDLW